LKLLLKSSWVIYSIVSGTPEAPAGTTQRRVQSYEKNREYVAGLIKKA
jgi:hypothetical protein